jgi:hypothetical protein
MRGCSVHLLIKYIYKVPRIAVQRRCCETNHVTDGFVL